MNCAVAFPKAILPLLLLASAQATASPFASFNELRPTQPFTKPKATFEEAVEILNRRWYTDELNLERIYHHALKGLCEELPATAAKRVSEMWSQNLARLGSKGAFEDALNSIRQADGAEGIDDELLYYRALVGLLRELSPDRERSMLQLLDPETSRVTQSRLAGKTVAVGIALTIRENKLIASDITPGSPADRSGIRVGTRIHAIGPETIVNVELPKLQARLEQAPGTSIDLTVEYRGAKRRVQLVCKEYEALDARPEVLGDVGLLTVINFSKTMPKAFKHAINALGEKKLRGMIIDLRGNPGGDVVGVQSIACHFLSAGTTTYFEAGRGGARAAHTCNSPGDESAHLVILANEGTVSSGEMVAAALSQNNRAKIVGVTTKGYGAQKEGWTLQNKFRFRFITEMILGPDGTSFLGKGVSPDVYLPMAQDRILESRMAQRESERMRIDIQLAEAVRLVQGGR